MKKAYQMYIRNDGSNTIDIRLGEISDAKDKDTFKNVFCCHNEGVIMTWETAKGPITFKRQPKTEIYKETNEETVTVKTMADTLKVRTSTVNKMTDSETTFKPLRLRKNEEADREKYALIMTRQHKNSELISAVNIFQIELPDIIRFGDIEFQQTYNNFKGVEEISFSPAR